MGNGTDMGRAAGNHVHAQVLDNLKDQLLIVFLKNLQARGHDLVFSCAEIDDTGSDLLSFRVDRVTRDFHFALGKKQ